jgi:3'-phosphoadenosine 5'-phosphosulfate sulfotransferase (PAPS reductase)/FAD synthetase
VTSPYYITGPALIQVSGGRTSGFMLRQILDAHNGQLPADVIPTFQNTGREHEATLQFLREIETRWNCPITWLEYKRDGDKHTYSVVEYCSASRNGEPFAALIESRKYLPTPITRFCSTELKIRTGARFAQSQGWDEYTSVVGLRADEPRRVAKIKGDRAAESICLPMAQAGHTEADVLEFWKSQPFDLMLPGGDNTFGNCDLCFLKRRAKLDKIIRTNPESVKWWDEQERKIGKTFRIDRPSYRQMFTQLTVQGQMFDDAVEDETMPCQCTD